MKILVLGAGATGGYFGGRLLEGGADVTFLVRPQRAAQLARAGLAVVSPLGNIRLAVKTVLKEAVKADYDAVVLGCKAYDLDAAINALRPAMGPHTIVVPLLNGIAHLDVLDAAFGPARILGGLCHLAVTMDGEGVIKHLNDFHRITFGPRRDEREGYAEALLQAFQRTPVTAKLSGCILHEMWEKFVFLATLAGATCLMRASIGDILRTDQGKALILELLDCCARVADAGGYAPSEAYMDEARRLLTTSGSTYSASMLRDMERSGRIEADHVIGDMYRRAQGTCIPAALLGLAFTHLQTYEARRNREQAAQAVR